MARMAVIVLILGVCLPEVLPAGVVLLKAGEIDSGKVRVGVFAEVVYGKGARDPVSGEWEKLGTARGYIKAVDAEHLTIALRQGLGKKRIAFARIQKLLLAKSSRDMARLRKTTDMELPFARTDARGWRSEGRRIRIHTRGMEEGIVARFHRVTRDTLFFKRRIREKRPASIAITDISGLEVYKYRGSYAKKGAIAGAVTGLILPFIVFSGYLDDGEPGELDPESLKALTAIMFFSPTLGFVGGMGGAFVGGMFGYDVWQAVDLSPSTVEGRHRLSFQLSFRF